MARSFKRYQHRVGLAVFWSQVVAAEQLLGQLAAMEVDSLLLLAGRMAVMRVELLVHNRRAVHLV